VHTCTINRKLYLSWLDSGKPLQIKRRGYLYRGKPRFGGHVGRILTASDYKPGLGAAPL